MMNSLVKGSILILLFLLLAIPLSYAEIKEASKYKDWEVDMLGSMVLYSTHGQVVHGHRFGWLKKAGACDADIFYLTYSSHHEDKNVLVKLTKNKMPLKVQFPQAEGASLHLFPDIVAVNELGSLKIVTLLKPNKEILFDEYMSKLNLIKIEVDAPYNTLFDIPFDTWSLNGYIAAKLKAQEMCEAMTLEETKVDIA